ncbi:hypothetical protein PV405_08710 [Streptomyces sp. ME02-6979-3A]|uniref:hypothetical protein n=1 Tax=Streptomyces sp. ME02-6979-3A TaxID=3028673 RepID=UPI0029AE1E8A|nr:hypothetical protein [Streptomyces sp. ME02-6979-3A]MDX3324747.1 hypothetical protein [Streptomyces sp. ME02-6979-3A]
MATTDDYGQGVSIAQLTDPPDAETLAKNIANAIVQRSNLRFASASARTAAIPTPVEGMEAWLNDTDTKTIYNGTAWVTQSKLLMDWTALSSLGSYATGFAAALPVPRMRKVQELGSEVWELEGRIAASPALTGATTHLAFTFSSGHRVANGRGFSTYNSSHYGTRVTVASDGKLTVSVPTEAGNTVTNVWLDGIRITNPAA